MAKALDVHRLAFEQSPHGSAVVSLADARFVDANDRFCRLLRRDRHELVGSKLFLIADVDDFEDIKAHLEAYIKQVGGLLYCDLRITRHFDDENQQAYLLISLQELTEPKGAELSALSAAEQLSALLDVVPAAIWFSHDAAGNRISCNQVARDWIQLPKEFPDFFTADAKSQNSRWSETRNGAGEHLDGEHLPILRAARGERVDNFEGQIVLKDGEKRSIFGHARPLFDTNGQPRGAVSAYIDITDLKHSEARQQLLAGEVNHRARNILSVVQAVIQLTKTPSVEAFRKGLTGRISSLARVHSLISGSQWGSIDLRQLVEAELTPFGIDEPNQCFSISGPDISLTPSAAQAFGLALHELATNAAKYGALSQPNGKLRIDWDVIGARADKFRLSWWEYDSLPTSAPEEEGFGTTLIKTSIEDQLSGQLLYRYMNDGLKFEVCCPIDAVMKSHPERFNVAF